MKKHRISAAALALLLSMMLSGCGSSSGNSNGAAVPFELPDELAGTVSETEAPTEETTAAETEAPAETETETVTEAPAETETTAETTTTVTEATEPETEAADVISASDIAGYTFPEIIALMGGEYTLHCASVDGIGYIENYSVLQGMDFYFMHDDVWSMWPEDVIDSPAVRADLESGAVELNGIEVMNDGWITDSISADMTYLECCQVLGNFDCESGGSGVISGSPSSAEYEFYDNGVYVGIMFEPAEYMWDAIMNGPAAFSHDEMAAYDPVVWKALVRG